MILKKITTTPHIQPKNLVSQRATTPDSEESEYSFTLGDPKPISDVLAPEAFEQIISTATDPGALIRQINSIRSMLESSETATSSGENKILGMFGEKFNEEGFHSEHPQIAAICEFLPIFAHCEETSNLSISETDLNKIIARKDLRATVIHDLIEIQKLIRNSVVESTTELFEIFYRNYYLEDMQNESLQQDLDSNVQELFEFKNFVALTQKIDQ